MPSRSSECGNKTCPFSEFNDVSDHILSRLQIADAIIWRPDEDAALPPFFAVGPDGKAAFVLRGENINSGSGVKATIFKFVVSREGNEAMLRRVNRTKLLEKRIRRTWEHGLSGPDCRATDDVLFSCDRERGKRDHPARFDYPDDRGQTGAAWRGDGGGGGRPSCHQCCCSVLTTHCSANGQRRRQEDRGEGGLVPGNSLSIGSALLLLGSWRKSRKLPIY